MAAANNQSNTAVKPYQRGAGWWMVFWGPVVLIMAAIFTASSLPGTSIPSLFSFQDIIFHGIIYLLLGLFFYRALKSTTNRYTVAGLVVLTVIFGGGYGLTDEFHQLFVYSRSCSGFDLMIDAIGSLLGGLVGGLFLR